MFKSEQTCAIPIEYTVTQWVEPHHGSVRPLTWPSFTLNPLRESLASPQARGYPTQCVFLFETSDCLESHFDIGTIGQMHGVYKLHFSFRKIQDQRMGTDAVTKEANPF
jgi:hypothetical protein